MGKTFTIRCHKNSLETVQAERLPGQRARIVGIPEAGKLNYGDIVAIIEPRSEGRLPIAGEVLERPFPEKIAIKYDRPSDRLAIVRELAAQGKDWPLDDSVPPQGDRPGFLLVSYPQGGDIETVLAKAKEGAPNAHWTVVPLSGLDDEDEEDLLDALDEDDEDVDVEEEEVES